MNNIQIFQNDLFGQVRTTVINGEPWFVGNDIATALGYQRPADAVAAHVDDEDRQLLSRQNTDLESVPNRGITIINESGLYSLTLSSKLPDAKKFKRWITKEVIPSIRKNGCYGVPRTFAEALRLAADQQLKIEQQQQMLEIQKPKAEFFDTVADSKTAIEMKAAANVLNFHKVGRNKLFQILRDNKILTPNNQPYQKYIDCGYFRTIEQKWQTPNGDTNISIKTLVYQPGVDYIRKLLLNLGYKPNPKENK